jgi:putative peptidoglycan lipid II flippase
MVSRVLGLVREAVLAAVFGARWVLDSFYLAFQLPNLFRRLFGEGALSAAFIPVFTRERECDPEGARRLASAAMTLLLAGLGVLTFLGELALLALWALNADNREAVLFYQLAAVMLAFFPAVCATAILGGMLNVLRHFAVPAAAPAVLNLCMIAGALFPMSRLSDNPDAAVHSLAIGVTIAGLIELAWLWRTLSRCGVKLSMVWQASHPGLRAVGRTLAPIILGLGVLQLMEFVNSTAVRMLTAPADDPNATFTFLGMTLAYPLAEGSLTVLQCAQRIYQFPLGVFATALGTAVFPLFSLYAARNDNEGLTAAVAKAVRLSLFIGVPAGVGMMLTAEPVTRLLFERGRFGVDDTARTAQVVFWYGAGMWAFCLHQIVSRAYYSLQDSRTPVRVSLALLPLNFGLNVGLFFVPGVGIAAVGLSTAATFSIASLWMLAGLRRRMGRGLPLRPLLQSGLRAAPAVALMAAAVWATIAAAPTISAHIGGPTLVAGVGPVLVGALVFAAACAALKMPELRELLRRDPAAS